MIKLIYLFPIIGVTLQKILDSTALTLCNGIDVNGDALDKQLLVLVVKDIKQTVLADITLELQQYVKVAVLVAIAIDSRTDNLHADNRRVYAGILQHRLKMLTDILQDLLLGIALQACNNYRRRLRLVFHHATKPFAAQLETLTQRYELVLLVIDNRGKTLQGSCMSLLADCGSQRQYNALTQGLNTCLCRIAAVYHIVNNNGQPVFRKLALHTDTKVFRRDGLTVMGTLVVILALPWIALQYIGNGNMGTLCNSIGQIQRRGGIAVMTRCWNQYHIRTDIRSHQVCGLFYCLLIIRLLDFTGKGVQLPSIAVNGHKGCHTIADVLIQGLPEQIAGLFHIA